MRLGCANLFKYTCSLFHIHGQEGCRKNWRQSRLVNLRDGRRSSSRQRVHHYRHYTNWIHCQTVAYRGVGEGGWVVQTPPPTEIPKALQNRAKLNPIVKTVKNC